MEKAKSFPDPQIDPEFRRIQRARASENYVMHTAHLVSQLYSWGSWHVEADEKSSSQDFCSREFVRSLKRRNTLMAYSTDDLHDILRRLLNMLELALGDVVSFREVAYDLYRDHLNLKRVDEQRQAALEKGRHIFEVRAEA